MIDMLGLLHLAAQLGGRAKRSDTYDEVVINPQHFARMGTVPACKGATLSTSEIVPDGIGIFRQDGRVMGAIDFADKRTMFINNPTEWFEIEEKSR